MSPDDWTRGFGRHSFQHGGGSVSWLELPQAPDGGGEPIVLVHGIQGSALEHCGLARHLSGGGPIYLLDLRAHGRSAAAPANPIAGSIPDQVSVVVDFLKNVVGRPAILVGNSFGAMVSANVAAAAPESLLGLVLVGPAARPSISPIDLRRFLQWLVQKPQWVRRQFDRDVLAGKRPEDPDTLVATGTPYLELVPPAYVAALRAEPQPAWAVGDPAGRASLWRGRNDALAHMAFTRNWLTMLRETSVPALWLHGTDDPIMPPLSADTLSALLPNWAVETIGATGHIPHVERSEWTAERILDWIGTSPWTN